MIGFAQGRNRFWDQPDGGGPIPLENLPAGRKGTVFSLDGPQDAVHRLQELGLRPGAVIRMFRPGNPCIICLGGCKLAVRPDDQVRIFVNPLLEPHGCCHRHRHGWGLRQETPCTPPANPPSVSPAASPSVSPANPPSGVAPSGGIPSDKGDPSSGSDSAAKSANG